MKWIARAGSTLRFFFKRTQLEDELDEELRSYFDLLVDRYVGRGMNPEQGRMAARREFEGMEQVKENVRERLAGATLDGILQDVGHAWRALRKSGNFSILAITTLAIGIGVNTAVFSVFYGILMRPLPFDRPEQLALIWSNFQKTGAERAPTSGTILGELQRRATSLQEVAGIWVATGTFTGDENPEQVKAARVTPNFFQTLGAHAALGRTFTPDETFGGRSALILSDGLWRRRFGADPAIIGKRIPFQGASATVVGVMPPGFQLFFPPESNVPRDVEAFIPFPNNIYKGARTLYFIRVLARLKPGVSLDDARKDLDRVASDVRGAYTEFAEEKLSFTLAGMQADAVRDIRPALVALFGGAGFVLLICCANVTNLLLARASHRRREIAVRTALGASRGRIVRQLLSEAFVLCGIAGIAGVGMAWTCTRLLARLGPERLTQSGDIGLNWAVLSFTALVSLAAVMLFGLAPGMEVLKPDVIKNVRDGARAGNTRLQRWVGAALVVTEVMTGFMLVIGGGLMARTLRNVERVRPGFEAQNLLTFQVAIGRGMYAGAQLNLEKNWETKLGALPGVERAGAVSHLPLDDFPNWYSPYRVEGKMATDASAMLADYRCITPGYLEAMGVRLLEGRSFNQQDRAGGRMVAIVDEMVARTAWPGQSAVGKKIEAEHVTGDGFQPLWSEVVGVVEHVRNHSIAKQVRGEIYLPFEQSPRSPLSYALRTRVEPLSLVPEIRRELHALDPSAALSKVRPMTAYVQRDIAPTSFTAVLAGIFAGIGLVLAAIGIYGVLHYQVSRRVREIAIRMALGATRSNVLGMIMREGLALTGIGLALGLVGAAILSRYMRALVYGVSVSDPVSYAMAFVLLTAAAALGCWRPASRASSANPADVARMD